MRYISTVISGCENIILDFLHQDISDIRIIEKLNGLIFYETNTNIDIIRELKYLNNTFVALKTFDNLLGDNDTIINKMISETLNDYKNINIPKHKIKVFKIFNSIESNLVSPNGHLISQLIDKIQQTTKSKYNSVGADTEFWFIARSEKLGFFTVRITKNKKKLMAGELRPEIAYILCRLSEPKDTDIFCDPFCGSGAIPLERSRIADYRGIFAMDINPDLISALKAKTKKIKNAKFNKSFFIKCQDFLNNSFDDNFVDVIVTDPPWGYFQNISNDFYDLIMAQFARIIKPNGRLILLTAQKEKMQNHLATFDLKNKYDILLSGQKAGIFVFIKK